MDITSLYNVSSGVIKQAEKNGPFGAKSTGMPQAGTFGTVFDAALKNLDMTNNYLSDAENEKVKWMLGESENTHDLTIALGKASTALRYTIAVRDKFLESYKEIMNMQI